jgi:hypothetical protein
MASTAIFIPYLSVSSLHHSFLFFDLDDLLALVITTVPTDIVR